MENTLCPAEEALRFQGVDTVTWVKEASFWWSVPLPRARSPHGAPCVRLGDEVPSAPIARHLLLWEPSGTLGAGGEF